MEELGRHDGSVRDLIWFLGPDLCRHEFVGWPLHHNIFPSDIKKAAETECRATRLMMCAAFWLAAEPWRVHYMLSAAVIDRLVMRTTTLIDELPRHISIPDHASNANVSRRVIKFSPFVRNPKSQKYSKTNFFYKGYAQAIRGEFEATETAAYSFWNTSKTGFSAARHGHWVIHVCRSHFSHAIHPDALLQHTFET